MPAEIESAVVADQRTWHGLETILSSADNPVTVERVFEVAPLFAAKVEGVPVLADIGTPLLAERWKANVRRNYDLDHVALPVEEKVLGIVRDGYRIVQPYEQAELLRDLLIQGQLELESALSLRDGAVTVLLARMPGDVVVAGDDVARYIAIVNSYDGSYSLTVVITPIRIVCMNTLQLALSRAQRTFKVRHVGDMAFALADVRTALGLASTYIDAVAEYANHLAGVRLTPLKSRRFVERLIPVPDQVMRVRHDDGSPIDPPQVINQRAINGATALRARIIDLHDNTEDIANHRGTAWGWMQAVSTYMDHEQRGTVEGKFLRTLGNNDTILTRAQRVMDGVI